MQGVFKRYQLILSKQRKWKIQITFNHAQNNLYGPQCSFNNICKTGDKNGQQRPFLESIKPLMSHNVEWLSLLIFDSSNIILRDSRWLSIIVSTSIHTCYVAWWLTWMWLIFESSLSVIKAFEPIINTFSVHYICTNMESVTIGIFPNLY